MRGPSPVGILLAAVFFVVGAAAAGLVARSASPTWQSTAILDIDQPRVVAAARDPSVIDKLSRLRYKYVGLVKTDRIAGPVAQALGEDVVDVRKRLDAGAIPSDLLIRVGGTGADPAQARRTSDALAVALADYVAKEQADDDIPSDDRVMVEVVDVAAPALQIGPARGAVGLAALFGGGIAGGLTLLGASAVGSGRRSGR